VSIKNKSKIILFSLIFILIISMVYPTSTVAKIKAQVVLEIDWDLEEAQKPVVPRDEIKELDIVLKFRVVTNDYVGKGVLIGYYDAGAAALININIIETSPWCSAVLNRTRVSFFISEYEEANLKLFMAIDEDAPAYGDGFIKIQAKCPYGSVGILEGFVSEFELTFSPSYLPIIKADLPESNTKRITPQEKAIFPIEIENLGNARTEILFDIDNVPEGWGASISDTVIVDEAKGSKAIAYLRIIPPNELGFHYDEANIRVKMTPVMTENYDEVGYPLFATFTVQNRGSSTSGIELVIFLGIIVLMIIFLTYRYVIKKRKG